MSHPQMAWYPGNTGALPSQMGYYPGPTPPRGDEIVKADIGESLRRRKGLEEWKKELKEWLLTPNAWFMCAGTLMLAMLSIAPIWNALSLLSDMNYTFWVGHQTPQCMIVACILIIFLYPLTILFFFGKTEVSEQNVMMLANTFLTLFGLVLMIISVSLSIQAEETSNKLLYSCDVAEETHRMYEYSHVLQNIRANSECAKKYSVVNCAGYMNAAPYTNMLKSMEDNFRCAGFCYKAQFASNKTHLVSAVSALSITQQVKKQHRVNAKVQQSIATDSEMVRYGTTEVATFPPTLFSDSNFQASCEGMAARNMRNVAGDIGHQTFFQGLYLVLIATITGFLKLFGFCVRKS